jgi:hypothetical protein
MRRSKIDLSKEKKPLKRSGGSKERMLFCKVCKKKTRHTTPFMGFPFRCAEIHFGGTECCQKCGRKLSEGLVKLAKALGALVYCEECSSGSESKKGSWFIVRNVSPDQEE